MSDDVKITATLELNAGTASADGQKAGQQFARGLESGFKPNIDLGKSLNTDAIAKKLTESLQSAIKGLNLGDEIAKSFAGIDLSKSGFGDSLKKTVADAMKGAAPSSVSPTAPHTPSPTRPQQPEVTFSQRVQPLLSGLESMSMLLRGSPLTSVFQMAGQAARDFSALRQASQAAAASHMPQPGAAVPPGGGPPIPPIIGGFNLGSGSSAALKAGGYAAAIGGIVYGVKEASHVVSDLGVEAARTNLRIGGMAKTLDTPRLALNRLREEFAGSDVDFDSFTRSLVRMAVAARRDMPEVEDKVKRYTDTIEESNIKVREGENAVKKAREDRQLATDKVSHSEGELAKFEAVGGQLREQQARGAALGVSGAQVGLLGAQMQARAAGIGQQFAPQEAALANIAGPLTVKGAKLGVEGARLAADQARYQRFVAGGGKDPDWAQRLAIQAADHGEKIAAHNIEQAKLHEQQAKVAEEKRQTTDAAGLGPEGQARQAALAANQAVAQANLHLDRSRVTQESVAIEQQYNTERMEATRLQAERNQARREAEFAPDVERRAETALRDTQLAREKAPYAEPAFLQGVIQNTLAGEKTPGFNLNRALAEPKALRDAIFLQGGFKGMDSFNVMRQFLQGQKEQGTSQNDLMAVMQSVFPGRETMGGRGQSFLSAILNKTPLTEAQEKHVRDITELQESMVPESQKAVRAAGFAKSAEDDRKQVTGFKAIPLVEGALNFQADISKGVESLKQAVLGGLSSAEQGMQGIGKVFDSALKIPAGAGEVASALSEKAREIRDIKIAPPTATPPESTPPANTPPTNTPPGATPGGNNTVYEEASGGHITGHGSQTSDNIPIMASNNEFMMQEAAVQKYGVPFMDAVNAGKLNFAEGGGVDVGKLIASGNERADRARTTYGPIADRLRAQGKLGFAGGGQVEIDERKFNKRKENVINLGGGSGVSVTEERGSGTINLAAGGWLGSTERDDDLRAVLESIRYGLGTFQDIFLPGRSPANNPYVKSLQNIFKAKQQDARASAAAKLDDVPLPRARPSSSMDMSAASAAIASASSNLGARDIRVPASTRSAVNAFAKANAINSFIENGKQVYELTPANVEISRKIALGLPLTKEGEESTYRPAGGSLSFALSPDKKEVYLGRTPRGGGVPNFPPGNFGREEFEKTIKDKGGQVLDYNEYKKYNDSLRPESKEIYNPNLSGAADNEAAPIGGKDRPPSSDSGPVDKYVSGAADRPVDSYYPPSDDDKKKDDSVGGATGGAIRNLMRGFAGGGLVGGFTNAVASVPGYANGGATVQSGASSNTLSAHQLDLRTDAGTFSAKVDDDTLQGINNSALSRKLSQTGPAPSWWS